MSNEDSTQGAVWTTFRAYVLVALLVLLVYSPTFSGGFILDDHTLIEDNPYIREIHSIASYLSQEDGIVHEGERGAYHTGYYRPLINLTYWLDLQLWGMKAPGFRVTNLFLHLITSLILFRLLILLLHDSRLAFWTAMIFSLHPVNTESVSMVIARNNILVTLFALVALYFYVIGWERKITSRILLSILFFAAAVFSKEFGVMLFPVIFLYHRFLSPRKDLHHEMISYLPFVLVAVLYFFLREQVIGAVLTPFDMAQAWKRAYLAFYVIAWNLRVIFLPYGLHQFDVVYPPSLLHWQAVLSLLSILAIGTWLLLRRKDPLVSFSFLSFLVTIFPVLSIVTTPSTPLSLISLRWLYMPLAFLLPGVIYVIRRHIIHESRLIPVALSAMLVYLGIYSYFLNRYLWHDEDTFLTQEVVHFNNDIYAGLLAESLLKGNNYSDAERYFRLALEKTPYQASHFINYAALLIETGRAQAALDTLKTGEPLEMTRRQRGEWFNNQGAALSRLGKKEEALKQLVRAVDFSPDEPRLWANLGGAYGSIGDYRNAARAFEKGLTLSPDSIALKIGLTKCYMGMGEYHKSAGILEKIPAAEAARNKEILGLLHAARKKISSPSD